MRKSYKQPEVEIICFEDSLKGRIQTSSGYTIIETGNPDEAESDDFNDLFG